MSIEKFVAYGNHPSGDLEPAPELVRYVFGTTAEECAFSVALDEMNQWDRAEQITRTQAEHLVPNIDQVRTVLIGTAAEIPQEPPIFSIKEIKKETFLEADYLDGGGVIRAYAKATVEIAGTEYYIESGGRFLDFSGPENESEIQAEADAEALDLKKTLEAFQESLN